MHTMDPLDIRYPPANQSRQSDEVLQTKKVPRESRAWAVPLHWLELGQCRRTFVIFGHQARTLLRKPSLVFLSRSQR